MDWVIAANAPCAEVRRPDLNIFLDVDPDTAMERILRNRDHVEIFEQKERLARTRSLYLEAFERMKNLEEVVVIDGNRSEEEIAEDIWRAVQTVMNRKVANHE